MVCTNCYSQGNAKKVPAGSAVVEGLLYLFTIPLLCIPGLIYSHWRTKSAFSVCRLCRGSMVDDESPRGKQILANHPVAQ
jgi:hypothetical protein